MILFQPGPPRTNEEGELIQGLPIAHTVWANRRDRGGSEAVEADTQIGSWQTSYRIRWLPSIQLLSNEWWIFEPLPLASPVILVGGVPLLVGGVQLWTDRIGRIYDIEYVNEQPHPPRRWLILYCTAREGITSRGVAAAA